MSDRPTTASLRRLLERVLVTDSDFEAFCVDYFPTVAQRFANGNDRVQKLTLLLRLGDGQKILSHLREAFPDAVAEHAALLVYGDSPLNRIGYSGAALLLLGIAAVVALATFAAVRYHIRKSVSPASTNGPLSDGGASDLTTRAVVDLADDQPPDHAAVSGAPATLPALKILTPRQRKNATKLTAPLSSVEKFFQNAIDLGPAAELVTYKKIDPAQRQWITHVVLVDGRNQQPVSMIIYSEAQYKAWATDIGGIGELFRGTLVKIEAALSELSEYRISSEEFLLRQTAKTMEDAWYAYRFKNYRAAQQIAKAIAETPGETVKNRSEAWQIVGVSACKGGPPDMLNQAIQQISRLNPANNRNSIRAALCGSRAAR